MPKPKPKPQTPTSSLQPSNLYNKHHTLKFAAQKSTITLHAGEV